MVRLWVAVSQLLSRVSITQSRNTFGGLFHFLVRQHLIGFSTFKVEG